MNSRFLFGFLLAPLGAAVVVMSSGGVLAGVSAKDTIFLLLVSIAPCAAASSGFVVGRNTNAFSAAPLRSHWRSLFIALLGATCAVICIPVGVMLLDQLQGRGVWQPILVGLWFMVGGMTCGYFYGPAFRALARAFPRLKDCDVQDRVG